MLYVIAGTRPCPWLIAAAVGVLIAICWKDLRPPERTGSTTTQAEPGAIYDARGQLNWTRQSDLPGNTRFEGRQSHTAQTYWSLSAPAGRPFRAENGGPVAC